MLDGSGLVDAVGPAREIHEPNHRPGGLRLLPAGTTLAQDLAGGAGGDQTWPIDGENLRVQPLD